MEFLGVHFPGDYFEGDFWNFLELTLPADNLCSLDPEQAQQKVEPDLYPICLTVTL